MPQDKKKENDSNCCEQLLLEALVLLAPFALGVMSTKFGSMTLARINNDFQTVSNDGISNSTLLTIFPSEALLCYLATGLLRTIRYSINRCTEETQSITAAQNNASMGMSTSSLALCICHLCFIPFASAATTALFEKKLSPFALGASSATGLGLILGACAIIITAGLAIFQYCCDSKTTDTTPTTSASKPSQTATARFHQPKQNEPFANNHTTAINIPPKEASISH